VGVFLGYVTAAGEGTGNGGEEAAGPAHHYLTGDEPSERPDGQTEQGPADGGAGGQSHEACSGVAIRGGGAGAAGHTEV
jgi:hypothetical protein